MYWYELATAFVLSLILIGIVRHIALKIGLLDRPNSRSIHIKTTPRGAGIGFTLAVFATVLIWHHDLVMKYPWVSVSIVTVFLVGMLDDRRDTSPKTKFIVIILATIMLYCDGVVVDDVGLFFGHDLSLGWLALPFTVFAVSGFTNAMNLVDGLDGLSATISIVILSVFAFIGMVYHDELLVVPSVLFIASLSAFLWFNWYPASIFMGDSGSLTLGFVISVLAIRSLDYLPTVSILFIAAIPILDTLVVMIRRKRSGRSVFVADQCHLHHVLWHFFAQNTPRTVAVLGTMQTLYSFTGIYLDKQTDEGVLLALFLLNVFVLYLFLEAMIRWQGREC
jgi:UDP-GlcNAc:undecaprenyl-phosphate GlcNAc-1-phosphate transferase